MGFGGLKRHSTEPLLLPKGIGLLRNIYKQRSFGGKGGDAMCPSLTGGEKEGGSYLTS